MNSTGKLKLSVIKSLIFIAGISGHKHNFALSYCHQIDGSVIRFQGSHFFSSIVFHERDANQEYTAHQELKLPGPGFWGKNLRTHITLITPYVPLPREDLLFHSLAFHDEQVHSSMTDAI